MKGIPTLDVKQKRETIEHTHDGVTNPSIMIHFPVRGTSSSPFRFLTFDQKPNTQILSDELTKKNFRDYKSIKK